MSSFIHLALKATLCLGAVGAFSTRSTYVERGPGIVFSSKTESEESRTIFSPLSRDEVQSLLDNVPVYTVVDPSQDGLVLLKQGDGPEFASFYFFPEDANTKYAPFREKAALATWEVTQYPMGLVWLELITAVQQDDGPTVEYRLLPNKYEMASAKNILQQQQPESSIFNGYNEIPVFLDLRLRVQTEDGESKLPLYLGYEDVSQAARQSPGASVQVADLRTLVNQMLTLESEIDFRNAIFVPPTSPAESIGISATTDDLWAD